MSQRAFGGIYEGVLGADAFSQKLRRLAQEFPAIATRALVKEATVELNDAIAHTPIGGLGDPHVGQLRASGRVTEPFLDLSGTSVKIVFDEPYAVAEHFKRYRHAHGGQRLYLLRVMETAKSLMLERVGHSIQAELESLTHYGV
jgi:hypothetical protein